MRTQERVCMAAGGSYDNEGKNVAGIWERESNGPQC